MSQYRYLGRKTLNRKPDILVTGTGQHHCEKENLDSFAMVIAKIIFSKVYLRLHSISSLFYHLVNPYRFDFR